MTIKIGTRGSALALWQANWVKSKLEARYPDLEVELVRIRTTGDRILHTPLSKVGGKGLFVKEIEEALLKGEVQIAVHSMKDVPAILPVGLVIGAMPEREDARDVLIAGEADSWETLPQAARVGTSSLRRQCQLLSRRPDLVMVPLRGNVDTRLRKLESEKLDGVILAAAGIKRMNLEHRITEYFSPEAMIPAIGQGALGIEVREEDENLRALISFLKHNPTEVAVEAERSFLRTLGGGCEVPVAAWAGLEQDRLRIIGLIAEPNGSRLFRDEIAGSPRQAEDLGRELAYRILSRGGRAVLEKLLGSAS
jgi:hydroxymethylbilane synthase